MVAAERRIFIRTDIGRWSNAWHHVGRGEGRLLNILEVVCRLLIVSILTRHDKRSTYVLVQRKLGHWLQGIVLVWPNLRHIEDVPAVALGLLGVHDLEIQRPCRVIALLNGVVEILDVIVGRLTS